MSNTIAGESDNELSERESVLLEQVEWMRLISDNVPADISYIDPEQTYLYVNHGIEDLYGMPRKDIVGRRIANVVEPVVYENIRPHIEMALSGTEVSFEQHRFGKDGNIRYFQTSYRPHVNSSGDVVGCFIMLVDITDRVLAERESERKSRAANLLQNIALATNDAIAPEAAIQLCLDAICEYTGWPIGHALMPTKGSSREIESTKLWHIDDPERFELFRSITELTGFKPGIGLPGFILAYATPHWIEDITEHRDYASARLGGDTNVRAAFGVPVMVADDVAAVLEFYSGEIAARDNQLLDIVAEAGILIGRVIERAQNEARHEEAQMRLAGIVDIASEAIISVGADGRIEMFNTGAEEIFGYAADAMIGQTIERLLPERFRERHPRHIAEFLESPEISRLMNGRGVFYGQRADGTEFPAEASISKLVMPHDTVLTVILRDITKRIQAEEATKRAREEAEHASRTKSEFLANMSHELRTPLNAVIGFSQLLSDAFAKSGTDAEYGTYADHINSAGQHLLALVTDILEISKVEDGHVELDEENLVIFDVVDSCLTMTRDRATRGRVSIVVDIDDDVPLLRADERRLKQIILNLLTNAIKFTKPGGSVTVKAWFNPDSGFVLQVIDTGIGIALEDIPKALTRFQQISSALNRQYEGTGLGLPLSKSLAELHGGTLDLQSQVGAGTTVSVRLPAERAVPSSAANSVRTRA